MAQRTGVYTTRKLDGSKSYRASITFQNKHISLGSFSTEESAHLAYCEAQELLYSDFLTYENYQSGTHNLSFSKYIILYNFKTSGFYFKTPILLKDNYFLYFLTYELVLKFDVDDLFYYSTHTISKRGSHLFVSDYGMQVNVLSRYGIKNFAVKDRDYRFINGDDTDFRYANIEIINKYIGVKKILRKGIYAYESIIHLNGNYKIGIYKTETEAAIAYNKAVDTLQKKGCKKNFSTNFIIEVDEIGYASLYNKVRISKKIREYIIS